MAIVRHMREFVDHEVATAPYAADQPGLVAAMKVVAELADDETRHEPLRAKAEAAVRDVSRSLWYDGSDFDDEFEEG